MTSSLVATYNSDLSRVQLTLTGPDGTWLVERSTNQLLWFTVRGGAELLVTGGSAQLDDYEFAADVENFYRARPIALENLMEVFTSSGTWNKPANLVAVRVRVVGGGGAGGGAATTAAGQASAGAGGGGGGYAEKIIDAASLGATETVTVGVAGAGASGAAGGNGGTSSFGSHCSASGGNGGLTIAATSGGSTQGGSDGGIGSNGDINATGGDGGTTQITGGVINFYGYGGDSALAGTTRAASSGVGGNGTVGSSPGGGGSGGVNTASQATARAGGNGASGVVIVENIFWPPEA